MFRRLIDWLWGWKACAEGRKVCTECQWRWAENIRTENGKKPWCVYQCVRCGTKKQEPNWT